MQGNIMTRTLKITCCTLLVVALAMGGCARLPFGVKPSSQIVEPAKLNAGSAINSEAKQPLPWPSQEWWKMYADPQLDRLVAEATAGNPTMRIAQSRIAISQARSGIAKSTLLPTMQAEASFTREQYSGNYFIPPPYANNWAWDNIATVGLVYELDLWGKNRSTLGAALDQVQMTAAEAQEVRLALETAVIRVYVQLSLQFKLLDVAQETLHQRRAGRNRKDFRVHRAVAQSIERACR
jgi:outer membrane protein TolC